MTGRARHIIVIGAGIGGLASALCLAHSGADVTVLERHAGPGGKMRTFATPAGPVDAGPTVLTLRPVFEDLFSSVGARLSDHITLHGQDILARHFWPDGTTLDLMHDPELSHENVARVFGARSAKELSRFAAKARKLFDAFDAPMMRARRPSRLGLTLQTLRNPKLIPAMAPHQSLSKSLFRQFSDPRLAQLFARYATYVGGLPTASPAILGLISHAESNGVWHVKGGMHSLACAIEGLAQSFGAQFRYGAHVARIETTRGRVTGVHTDEGRIPADAVVFNGDPRALCLGMLGQDSRRAVPAQEPRSLSAYVHAFAAKAEGPALAGHNVFFAHDPKTEYDPLAAGQIQTDPTLYLCAQDRFDDQVPTGLERFEIIMNAAPTDAGTPDVNERIKCQTLILERLHRFGLSLTPAQDSPPLTIPSQFNQLFPGSAGSLYGRSPHGMMAAFKRPTARTKVAGLYLAGGGAHPGAGVPMATLSARHAAEAIMQDLDLTLTSRPVAMPGGTSTE